MSHEFVEDIFSIDILSEGFDFLFDWESSVIVPGVLFISIVVGLDDEPGSFIELVDGMGSNRFLFDDGSFITAGSGHDIVDGGSDILIFKSRLGSIEAVFIDESFSDVPGTGHIVVDEDVGDDISESGFTWLEVSGIDGDGEFSGDESVQSES